MVCWRLPPVSAFAPPAIASFTQDSTRWTASGLIKGPMSVPSSRGSPSCRARTRSTKAVRKGSSTGRHTGVQGNLSQDQRADGCPGGGLLHHGIAGRQRRRNLVRDEVERKIEGRNRQDGANRESPDDAPATFAGRQ